MAAQDPQGRGPAGPRAGAHDARGQRQHRLDHALRSRAAGAPGGGRPRPGHGARALAGRGEGGGRHRRQGGGAGRGGAGRGRREGSALRQDQRSQVRRRLLHLRAAPGGRADRGRGEPGQEGADPGRRHPAVHADRPAVPQRADDLYRLRRRQRAAVPGSARSGAAAAGGGRGPEAATHAGAAADAGDGQALGARRAGGRRGPRAEQPADRARRHHRPAGGDGAAGAAVPRRAHEGRAGVGALRRSRSAHLRPPHPAREDAT